LVVVVVTEVIVVDLIPLAQDPDLALVRIPPVVGIIAGDTMVVLVTVGARATVPTQATEVGAKGIVYFIVAPDTEGAAGAGAPEAEATAAIEIVQPVMAVEVKGSFLKYSVVIAVTEAEARVIEAGRGVEAIAASVQGVERGVVTAGQSLKANSAHPGLFDVVIVETEVLLPSSDVAHDLYQ